MNVRNSTLTVAVLLLSILAGLVVACQPRPGANNVFDACPSAEPPAQAIPFDAGPDNTTTFNNLVAGDLTLSDDLAVGDDATVTGDLAVTGAGTVGGDLIATGSISATPPITFTYPFTYSAVITIAGAISHVRILYYAAP